MFPSSRSAGSASGLRTQTLLARFAAGLLLLSLPLAAQVASIQREQKIASKSGNFTGVLGNDFRFGVSVADLGDFDGDGTRDVVVGAHRASRGGPERGALFLLFLNPDGTVREHREISALAGGLVGPLDDHDRFGISVCPLGDLDLDGTVDLAVGAYRDDDGGLDVGAVYVLFLAPDGSVKGEQKISALVGGFSAALDQEDSFGWSVEAIGDLDGDGIVELAVGATRDDGNDADLAKDFGALYLLFLRRDGTVKSHARIAAGGTGLGAVLRPRDRFGADVVRLEDRNGDGVEDIAVGAFGDDPLKYGKVFVLHLNATGTVQSWQEIGYGTGGFTGLLGKGDRFGISLAADDFDGDGLQDLVIGAVGDDDGGADAGALWVCLLDPAGRVRASEKISPDFGGFGGFLRPGDNFGVSVTTLGDVDRDGSVDLAVGAYQDDEGGFDRGAAWILFRAGIGLPVADFVSNPGSGEAPLAVSFVDRSSGSVSSWSWDFGDGTGSNQASPTHVFDVPGVYDVRLTVGGPQGSDALLRQRAVVVQVPLVPLANFSAAPVTGIAPLSVTFGDLSSGSISAWSWDFGDGTGSSLRFPKHVYAAVGVYDVSLTVSGPLGSSNKTVLALVRASAPPPVADFGAAPTSGLRPLAVSFSDLSSGPVTSWTWDFGDGTSSLERAPAHTYTAAGDHTVTLTVSGPDGSNTRTRPAFVQVRDPLTAAFDVASPGGIAPVTVQFSDRSLGGPSAWSWNFGDGYSSSERNPSHVFREGGTFLVTLTVTAQGLSHSASAQVPIGEPVPSARFSVSTAAGPAPLSVRFTDRSTGNITAWEWDFGDGTGSAERNPVHVYRTTGVFTVRFRVTSAGGVNGTVRRDLITVTSPFVPRANGQQGALAPLLNLVRRSVRF